MDYENNTNVASATSPLILEERHDSEFFCVYVSILDDVTDHLLLPGKRLTESELCRQMVCSRNTVRGTLSLLAHDKIIDLQPDRGAFAHVPDLKKMKDTSNTRIEVESMTLSVLTSVPDLETRPQPLYATIEQEGAASESGGRVGWDRLSNAFHVESTRPLDNDVLLEIMNISCACSSLTVATSDPLRREKRAINSSSHHGYREILDLLVTGKRNRVTKVIRRHLSACIGHLGQKLEM